MDRALDIILHGLAEELNRTADRIRPPDVYLDPEAVHRLFQDLTGLADPPRVVYSVGTDDRGGGAEPTLEAGRGQPVSIPVLYRAMRTVLDRTIPLVDRPEDVPSLANRLARIRGVLQSTRFPDGGLNLEIQFVGVRGLLFFTPAWFSSMIRPLLLDDRIMAFQSPVEALVRLHGPMQRTIFYHQTYGDNREHAWQPLVPAVILEAEAGATGVPAPSIPDRL